MIKFYNQLQKFKRMLFLLVAVSFIGVSCKQNNIKTPVKSTTFAQLPDSVKIDSLNALIGKSPKKAELYAQRSELFAKIGNVNKAITDLHLANTMDSLNIDYHIKLADFYLSLGKSEEVNRFLLKANQLAPNNKDVLYRLGNLYFYIQDHKKAMEFLNKAQDVDPYFAPVYLTKALVFLEVGDTARAIDRLQIAVEREPAYYDAYMQLGLLFSAKKDSIALSYFDNAIGVIPNSYEAYYAKGYFYQDNNKPKQAVKVYRQMLKELSVELPMVHYNLGYIEMIDYANYNQAIVHFDSSLIYQEQQPEAISNIAYCYEKMGQKQKARDNYKKALLIRPNFDVAVKGLNRLDK